MARGKGSLVRSTGHQACLQANRVLEVFRQLKYFGWDIERMKSDGFFIKITIFSPPCIKTLRCETHLIAKCAIAMIDGSSDRQSTRKLFGVPPSLPR